MTQETQHQQGLERLRWVPLSLNPTYEFIRVSSDLEFFVLYSDHDQVEQNNYYLISGGGYPGLLYDGLTNAVEKILEIPQYDYLVICVDADEESVVERKQYINDFIYEKELNLGRTKIEVIVQNRCMETWLLGNRKMFDSRQPQEQPLSGYVDYYDVSQNDPEAMGDYGMRNHADFHYKYLQEIFIARNIAYTKNHPRDAKERHYLEALQKRVADQPQDLKSLQSFLQFCESVKNRMAQSTE